MAVLTEQTRHIVNARILDRMKSTAVVVNMARGPIINESDLIAALVSGSIAGAGLDVFEEEPVTNELIGLENVTLSPHCLSWTDEMSLGNGSSCVRAIVAVANGRAPEYVINRDVLETPAFKDRLALKAG
jgi:phosphoglycerate dehydrogenase-like enzyme